MHGRDGEDGTVQELLEIARHPLHRLGRARPACAAIDKVLAKHLLVEAGIPTPEFFAFSETAFRELGAADALPAIEERLDFPIVVKPAARGSALGIKFAAHGRATCRRRSWRRSPTTAACCSSATSTGRDLAVSVPQAGGPEALPIVEAVPRDEDFYDFEARYEIGAHRLRLPGRRCPTRRDRAGAGARARAPTSCSGCYGFGRVDLMLDDETASCTCWRPTRSRA